MEKVKEREVVEVAEAEMESRCVNSINGKSVANIVSSLSSERPMRTALNIVSNNTLVTTEVLGSEILAEEDE